MKRILCCLKVAAFIIAINVNAQKQELATVLIPENLREDTNAVIRNTSVDIEVFDVDKMVIKEKRIITILNKLGNRNLRAGVGYDNNSKIVKLSAKIYDANGKELKKYSKNKFLDVSAVDGATLYSDSRIKYLDYTPTNYPYTVVFEYEKHTSSTGFVPNWNPIESYFVSIENSSYSLKTKKKP